MSIPSKIKRYFVTSQTILIAFEILILSDFAVRFVIMRLFTDCVPASYVCLAVWLDDFGVGQWRNRIPSSFHRIHCQHFVSYITYNKMNNWWFHRNCNISPAKCNYCIYETWWFFVVWVYLHFTSCYKYWLS